MEDFTDDREVFQIAGMCLQCVKKIRKVFLICWDFFYFFKSKIIEIF
jgi:hypothetical protein